MEGLEKDETLENESSQYHEYLRTLDDEGFVSHLKSLSQSRIDNKDGGETKIEGNGSILSVLGSQDPFDDGLDEILGDIAETKKRKVDFQREEEDGHNIEDPKEQERMQKIQERILGTEDSKELSNDQVNGDIQERRTENIDTIDVNEAEVENGIINEESQQEVENQEEVQDEVKEDEGDEIMSRHDFGDYGRYFHNKHAKQFKEDREYVKWNLQRMRFQTGNPNLTFKPIFAGCVIHVNGHTVPSINEIHRLVIIHGGKFLSFLGKKSAATHIVCDRLTLSKKNQFKNCKVVKAKWITDCIAKGAFLDWSEYRLIEDLEYGQKRLEFPQMAFPENTAANASESSHSSQSDASEASEDEGDDFLSQEVLEAVRKEESASQQEQEHNIQTLITDKKEANVGTEHMDAKHPDFLRHFFAHSRLHHLSLWKAELRLRILRRIVKNEEEISDEKKTSYHSFAQADKKKLIIHLDFDCFFATVSCLNRKDINIEEQPVAVSHGGRTSDVSSCNYVARKYGVKNGMWFATAKRICPTLIKVDYDFDSYEKCSNLFYDYLINLKLFDNIFPVLIDEVLLDAQTFLSMSDDPNCVESLIIKLRSDIHNITGCAISAGASHNVLLAKLALRQAKPCGQFYLRNNIKEFLSEVALKRLPGVGPGIIEKLAATFPINSESLVKDLLSLSKRELIDFLGPKTGFKLYNYARGVDDTSIAIDKNNSEAILGRKTISVDVNFGIRFEEVTQVDNFLMRLSEELCRRLLNLSMCGSRLSLKMAKRAKHESVNPAKYMGMGICDFVHRTSKLGVPTVDWGIVGSELKAMYRMMHIEPKELRGVAIGMEKLEDLDTLKKQKQMRFPLESSNSRKRFLSGSSSNSSRNFTMKNKDLTKEEIDWTTFKELPDDIQNELLEELYRRGFLNDQLKNFSPFRTIQKKQKKYLQQLIPSQPNSNPRYVRVLESPTKSRRTKTPLLSRTAIAKPTMEQDVPIYDESGSYDSSVWNALPSSIQEEVLKDLKFKEKVKHFDRVSSKTKLEESKTKRPDSSEMILTLKDVNDQHKLICPPSFLRKFTSLNELVRLLEGWVEMSMDQGGPHLEDVDLFVDYFQKLLDFGSLSRCINLFNSLRSFLDYQEAMLKYMKVEYELNEVTSVKEWKAILEGRFLPLLSKFGELNKVDIGLGY